jgi:hypothetical protein
MSCVGEMNCVGAGDPPASKLGHYPLDALASLALLI